MLAAERVLLYSLSVALAALLGRELMKSNELPAAAAVPRPSVVERPAAPVGVEQPASAPAPSHLTLVDRKGTPRLAISLKADGTPRLVMNDVLGRPGLELSLADDGSSSFAFSRGESQLRLGIDSWGTISCRLFAGQVNQQMTVQPSGLAEWRLSGQASAPEAVIRCDENGSALWELIQVGRSRRVSAALDKSGQAAIQIVGDKQTFTQMLLADNGEVEIGVGGGPNGIEALMRTDLSGAAEVALSSPQHVGGPRLSMLPSGEMGVRILGHDGASGPVMQLFKDGSSEITIADSKSQRGPVMFRNKEGASLVGIRGDKGKPGPRMFQAKDGRALIAVQGIGGSQAGLHVDPKMPAVLAILGTDGKPVVVLPQEAVAPEPVPETPPDQPAAK